MEKTVKVENIQEFLHQISNDVSVIKGLLSHATKDEKLKESARSYDCVKKSLERTNQVADLISDFKSSLE